ncbi:hypothetical protein DMUE_0979 [Dictyocoela muelleri]|nr:hypothetical protein DMUE_0979 [Dictyocoela muelleri]
MSFKNISSNKRNLIIASITIAVVLLFLIGFRMHGSSVVSEANEQQTAKIKEPPNFTEENKKYLDGLFKGLADKNINTFLFDEKLSIIKTVSKKFENFEDLKKMKIENDIKLKTTDYKIHENNKEKKLSIKLNFKKLTPDELVEEKSWSGAFYKMTGGYSLPSAISGISEHFQSLKAKLDKGSVGVSILGDKVHVFFYNESGNKVEDTYDIHGINEKLTAMDIFKYFLIFGPKEDGNP